MGKCVIREDHEILTENNGTQISVIYFNISGSIHVYNIQQSQISTCLLALFGWDYLKEKTLIIV